MIPPTPAPSKAAAIRARHQARTGDPEPDAPALAAYARADGLTTPTTVIGLLADVAAIGITMCLRVSPTGLTQCTLRPNDPTSFPGLEITHEQVHPTDALEDVIVSAIDTFKREAHAYLHATSSGGAGVRPIRASRRAGELSSGAYVNPVGWKHPQVERIEREAREDAERRRMEMEGKEAKGDDGTWQAAVEFRSLTDILAETPPGPDLGGYIRTTVIEPDGETRETSPGGSLEGFNDLRNKYGITGAELGELAEAEATTPHPFSPEGTLTAAEAPEPSPPITSKPLGTSRKRGGGKLDPRA